MSIRSAGPGFLGPPNFSHEWQGSRCTFAGRHVFIFNLNLSMQLSVLHCAKASVSSPHRPPRRSSSSSPPAERAPTVTRHLRRYSHSSLRQRQYLISQSLKHLLVATVLGARHTAWRAQCNGSSCRIRHGPDKRQGPQGPALSPRGSK